MSRASLCRQSLITSSRSFQSQSEQKPIPHGKKEDFTPPPLHPEPEVNFTAGVPAVSTVRPFLAALFAVGLALTTYGIYGFYEMVTLWPLEVRGDLRSGLRAKRKGDFDIAVQYLSRAWHTAREVPLATFGEDPLLKVSGIGIALAGLYEETGQLERAYKTYEDTLLHLRTASVDSKEKYEKLMASDRETLELLNAAEKMRAVAIAHKLGELAEILHKPHAEQEIWLVWAVEVLLRLIRVASPPLVGTDVTQSASSQTADAEGDGQGSNLNLVEELDLPMWSTSHDLAAPIEALGTFYAKHGNINYALPLYLKAASILIPPAPLPSSPENKCRGAQVMGNIAELLLRNHTPNKISPDVLAQAESWALKGLVTTLTTRKLSSHPLDVCEEAFAVLLYNVAMISELSGDTSRARELLNESLQQSKAIGLQTGITHAEEALKAMDTNDGLRGIKPETDEAPAASRVE